MTDKSIKTLIFDLGGVILDLSIDHTLEAFTALSKFDKSQVLKIFASSHGFELYEKGGMTDSAFRNFIREVYASEASDSEIDRCWNAMLRGIPEGKLKLLKRLMLSHQVILLSNTNTIHLNHINQVILPKVADVQSLDPYFHKTYYSHLMRKRKPDAEIFEQVLHENDLVPEHTLFLDDNEMNIKGANAVGIKTVHVTTPDLILEYFHE